MKEGFWYLIPKDYRGLQLLDPSKSLYCSKSIMDYLGEFIRYSYRVSSSIVLDLYIKKYTPKKVKK